ncbi:DUF6443 domain-containing protein [Hymenobacter metallicola]|uniref:DUF6443 domain-containing protein n=1 Tax=Hymenobacter metallicola TaxID=2563114 RepID=A0A4Z0Q0N2_9BACT|nr:DUF6443 domain-containing protein [Hymenobacter metallicola]TGE23527.1 hypothetical protein E5K02_20285 [Hymenobacter metallicola]
MRLFYQFRFLICLVVAYWFILTGAQAQAYEGQVPDSTELRVLRQFYRMTHGEQWTTRTNWQQDSVLARYGVGINQGDVISISLPGNQLQGSLPASLGLLTSLYTLDLSTNQLGGQLPSSLKHLQGLWALELSHNQLEGRLPGGLWTIPYLSRLNVSHNRLSGTVPDSAGLQQYLYFVQLQNNRFTGPLPATFGQMAGLAHLDLSANQFSGSLPSEWGSLQNLSYLFLQQNRLTGTIPAEWGGMQGLNHLYLSDNTLQGKVPNSLTTIPYLYQLGLQRNAFTGLPSWAGLTTIPTVQATENYLDFASIAPNFTETGVSWIPGFTFTPQRIRPDTTLTTVVGAAGVTLRVKTGGVPSLLHYQWERKVGQAWVEMPGKISSTLRLETITPETEGLYRARVRHDHVKSAWGADVWLYLQATYIEVLPYQPLARNEPQRPSVDSLLIDIPKPDAAEAGNYVRTYTARAAYTDAALFTQAVVDSVQVKTEYFDGLGRPVQTVLRQESPTRRDIVQPIAYDELGRQDKEYLPYTVANGTGTVDGYRQNALREQYAFYRGAVTSPTDPADHVTPPTDMVDATRLLPKTGVPYAAKAFEPSLMGRVLAQASAGENWMLGTSSNHAVTFWERPNTARDTVYRWRPGYDGQREELAVEAPYAPGELWSALMVDEQKHLSQTFTNKAGQMVLKQVAERIGTDTTWLKTYYLYDDFDRLRAVLPPLAVQRIRKNGGLLNGAGVEHLLFRYHYDDQGRLIEKLVPDQEGYAYTVYDELNRPILTQNVAQRGRSEWVATKYDAMGRVVFSALIQRPGLSRDTLQARASRATQLWEAPSTSTLLGKAYYTNQSYPPLTGEDQLLSISYYDGYDFDQNGVAEASYVAATEQQLGGKVPTADSRVTGQTTRTLVRVLGVNATNAKAWLTTTSFFDEKLRPIQVVSTTARGGEDVTSSRYDFAGKVRGSYTVHSDPTHTALTVQETPRYDHAGRLLSSAQSFNGAKAVTIARQSYNELGQVERKILGNGVQSVDYRYNIRGWLTTINNPDSLQTKDLWSMALHYEQGFVTPQYNGNIAGQTWRSKSDNIQRAYGYRYDNLNRLLQGDFVAKGATEWDQERDNYRFYAASYDANGNLLTLRRRGLLQEGSRTTPRQYGLTDVLRYRYTLTSDGSLGTSQDEVGTPSSNRLLRVDDIVASTSETAAGQVSRADFQDGTTTGRKQADYAYDVAGSMTSDWNKGISHIQYNYLHLPEQIEWQNGNQLQYIYTASGQKVAKVATEAGKQVRTDYLGAWQYEKDSLRWLNHSEGRLLALYSYDAAKARQVTYRYEYTIKDHLGNLRVAFHPGERKKYVAMLDSDPQGEQLKREQHAFDSASVSPPIRQAVGMPMARSGDGVAVLHAGGTHPQPLGPLKQLTVAQGDTVDVTAYAMYPQETSNSNWSFSLAGFVASMLQQQPIVQPTVEGSAKRVRVLPLLNIGLGLIPAVQQLAGGIPKAYLRILVYNADSALVASETKQLTVKKEIYERLHARVRVPEAGYVQAYVANESDTEVFFDDITVEHWQGLQVQENHYDPFGLNLVGLSKSATLENKFTWNGKEKQTEFGLNWHDHGWRFYDPTLGRWVVSDPDAEEGDQESWGTYQFGLDNAVRYNDLDGRQAGPGEEGTIAGTIYNTVVGIGVSVYNTVGLLSDLTSNMPLGTMPSRRAAISEDGKVSVNNRLPTGTGLGLAKQIGSDFLDVANVAAATLSGGESGLVTSNLTKGAGILLAKAGGTKVVANSVTQAAKKSVNKNSNEAVGNFVLYQVENGDEILKVGKANADDVMKSGAIRRVHTSERLARKAGYTDAKARVVEDLGRTTTGNAKKAEAARARDHRSNGHSLPLNREQDKNYHP